MWRHRNQAARVFNHFKIIDRHLDRFFRDDELTVVHETESETVHTDIYVARPDLKVGRDYYCLLSSGLSALPMKAAPKGQRYLELTMLLPPDWIIEYGSFANEDNWWPFRLMQLLTKYPHDEQTWLGYGHTFSYDVGETFSENCAFEGVLLTDSIRLPLKFLRIKRRFKPAIQTLALIPLYREEIDYKMELGSQALLERMEEVGLSEIVDVGRKPIV